MAVSIKGVELKPTVFTKKLVTLHDFDNTLFPGVNALIAGKTILSWGILDAVSMLSPYGVLGTLEVKADTLASFVAGELGIVGEHSVAQMLRSFFNQCLVGLHNNKALNHGPGKEIKPTFLKSIANPDGTLKSPAQEMVDPLSHPIVKLIDATRMYQRVHGTSGGSVYFCIAISADDKLKLAARYMNGSLSVRAEWAPHAVAAAKLQSADFKTYIDKMYGSIHLTAPSEHMMARALGALMVSLDVPWKTPWPSLSKLIELNQKGAH